MGAPKGAAETTIEKANEMDKDAKDKGILTKTDDSANAGSSEGADAGAGAGDATLAATIEKTESIDWVTLFRTLTEAVGDLSVKLDTILQKTDRSDAAIEKMSARFGEPGILQATEISEDQAAEIKKTADAIGTAKGALSSIQLSPSGAPIKPRMKVG